MTDSIIIATFQHKHGADVRSFASAELAEAWRQEIAADNWDGGPNEDMPTCPREAADRYFEFGNDVGDEWFSTESATVEGAKPDPVRDATPDLLAALRAVLPYAESRVEDLESERDDVEPFIWDSIDGEAQLQKAHEALDTARAAIAAAEGTAR